MPDEQINELFITSIKCIGPYLQVVGIEGFKIPSIYGKLQQIETVAFMDTLPKTGCIFIYTDVDGGLTGNAGQKTRVRLVKIVPPTLTKPAKLQGEVEFIDLGCSNAVVLCENLLLPASTNDMSGFVGGFSAYMVLGICKDWKPNDLLEIFNIFKFKRLEYKHELEIMDYKFVTLKWKQFDLAEYLVQQKKMGAPIGKDLLKTSFVKYLEKQQTSAENEKFNNNNDTNTRNQNVQHGTEHASRDPANRQTNSFGQLNAQNIRSSDSLYLAKQQQQLQQQQQTMMSMKSYYHPHQYQHAKYPRFGTQEFLPRQPLTAAQGRLMHLTNFRSMMTGISQYNNRIRFTGHASDASVPFAYVNANGVPTPAAPMLRLPFAKTPHTLPVNALGKFQPTSHIRSDLAASPPQKLSLGMQRNYRQQQQLQQPLPRQQYHVSNYNLEIQKILSNSRQININGSVAPVQKSPLAVQRYGFKISKLPVGSTHEICISCVENGPCRFSIQLLSMQKELTEMMNLLERIQLEPLKENIEIGLACIARYSEDMQLYRALIANVQSPDAIKVSYIDYGNGETVKLKDLYQIPEQFLKLEAFSLPFALAGLKELEPIDASLKKAFKDMVNYKKFALKVTPCEGLPTVQNCLLFDSENKSILDLLKDIQKTRLVYPKAIPLKSNDIVEIRYIISPRNFYVQKVEYITEFEKLMDDMFVYYNTNQIVPQTLSIGLPCTVKFESDWYRAEVIRADEMAIIVRHVDFGYEQKVTKNLLSTIAEKHLKLPRQAVHCCLKGFENNELNKSLASTQFEMLAEETNAKRRSFTVKVFRINPDGVNLVNLCTKDLNVMKKLYKLSMPFEQYLSLEKEEFNVKGSPKKSSQEAVNSKFSSAASSNDGNSVNSSKKSSKTLESFNESADAATVRQQKNTITNSTKQSAQPRKYQAQQNAVDTHADLGGGSVHSSKSSRSQQSHQQQPRSGQEQKQQQQQVKARAPSPNQPHSQMQQKTPAQRLEQYSNASNSKRNEKGQGSQQRKQGRPNSARTGNESTASGDQRSVSSSGSNKPAVQRDSREARSRTVASASPRAQTDRRQNAPKGYSQSRADKRGSHDGPDDLRKGALDRAPPNSAPTSKPEEYQPLNTPFKMVVLKTPTTQEVLISWWVSPHQFYVQPANRVKELDALTKDLEAFYSRKTGERLPLKVGCNVIVRHRRERTYYRAKILACHHMTRKYKVLLVDQGSQYTATADDFWSVERRFAEPAVFAHRCSFKSVISNYDQLYILDRMEKYLPTGSTLSCEFKEFKMDQYFVDVKLKGVSLKDRMIKDRLINEISSDFKLSLLAGQQIRGTFCDIVDMLNFKIKIEGCDLRLLCAYDDARYVKSNPDVVSKFKQFYEGKSFTLNIKDVTDDKVLLLRPLSPLLKDDLSKYICSYPMVYERFEARVVYIASASRVYVQLRSTESRMSGLLKSMCEFYESNKGKNLVNLEQNQICAAKSADENWYRARVVSTSASKVTVYCIDYGNIEELDVSRVRQLEERFYCGISAFGVEVNLPLRLPQQTKKSVDESNTAVVDALQDMVLNKYVKIECLECYRNHLVAEMFTEQGLNIVDRLKEKQLIKGRDIDYIHKCLEKDKSNVHVYIELVDLTKEDEEENIQSTAQPTNSKIVEKKVAPVAAQKNENKAEADKKSADTEVKDVPKPEEEKVKATDLPLEKSNMAAVPGDERETSDEVSPASVSATATATGEEDAIDATSSDASPEESLIGMDQAMLSHSDSPTQFFIHQYDKVDELRNLQENLQIVASSLPALMNAYNGAYCISLYYVDKQWYRAQIIDAELLVLKFIDYGNTDCVNDLTDIKEMSIFPDINAYCVECSLAIRPNGTSDWSDAVNSIFNELYGKVLYYKYLTHGGNKKVSYIQLFADGKDVAEKLIADGFARPLEIVDSGENCYISHVNDINDFYIQYEKDAKGLELIEEYFAAISDLPKLSHFEKNKIVAAIFPDDGKWYRAKLLREIPGEKAYEVLFIDYGNTSATLECREIPNEMAILPSLSKKCALELPENYVGWSEAAQEKFAEIAASGETIFTIVLCAPGPEYVLVNLLIDGHNINDELLALCDAYPAGLNDSVHNKSFASSVAESAPCENGKPYVGLVNCVNDLAELYVHLDKDTHLLEEISSNINALTLDQLESPQVGQCCAAIYSVDKNKYRVRVLEILPPNATSSAGGVGESNEKTRYRVLFIDFGNEEIVEELYRIPSDLADLEAFVKHCKLANAEQLGELEAAALAECIRVSLQETNNIVSVEFIDQECKPNLVKIFINDYDMIDRLKIINEAPIEMIPVKCFISHVVSPALFYIQLQNRFADLECITKSFDEAKSKGDQWRHVRDGIAAGEIYGVFAVDDDCYYRGRLDKAHGSSDAGYEVYLIDYGNTINTKELRELPAELKDIPPIADKCRLSGDMFEKSDNPSKMSECFQAVVDSHFGETLDIVFFELDKDAGIHVVKLQVNYKDLADELTKAMKCGDEQSISPVLHDCVIVEINSITSFYVQMCVDVSKLEQITDRLLDTETAFEPLSQADIESGLLCAAQCPDDGVYYRAKIMSLVEPDQKECKVHFVDFGNESIAGKLYKLPDDLSCIPRLSKNCSLDISAVMQLQQSADTQFGFIENEFQMFIDSRSSETFQIEVLKEEADHLICVLYHQNQSVVEQILENIKSSKSTAANAALQQENEK